MNAKSASLPALGLALALVLWRGGFFHPAQVALAAVALVATAVVRPRPDWRDPVLLGLIALGAANVCAAALAGWSGAWPPALAAAALAPLYAIARGLDEADRSRLALVVALIAATCAAAGIVGWILRSSPQAERIDSLWRAAGPFEYPPALALMAVCGLAATLALVATSRLPRSAGTALTALLGAAVLLSFDRLGLALAVAVVAVFASRPAVRSLWPALVALALVAAAGLAAHPPGGAALSNHLGHDPLAGRSDVWSQAWSAFGRRPLEGYGPGGFARIELGRVGGATAGLAHDVALEQAVEAGVVALLGTCIVLAVGGWRCARRLRSDPMSRGYACMGLAVALSGLVDFTWSFAPLALLGVVSMATCAAAPVRPWRTGAVEKLTAAARRQPSRSP